MKHPTHSTSLLAPLVVLLALALVACDAGAPSGEPTPETAPQSDAPAATGDALEGTDALRDALADRDPFERARRLGGRLPTLGAEAVPFVKEALEEFRLDLSAVEFELLLRFWALQEPAEATAWAFKHGPPLYRINGARVALEIYAEADPAGAVVIARRAFLESTEDIARVAQIALVRGWFARKDDRESLEQYIHGLGSGIERQRAAFAYALSLAAEGGGEAAIAWGEAVPEEDRRYKLEVFRQVMSALAWGQPEAARRFCEKHCDGPFGMGLREVLVRSRVRDGEYGGDVVEWVAGLPAEGAELQERKVHSLKVAYSIWAAYDHPAAIEWMERKVAVDEPEPWLQPLYEEFSRQLAPEDPVRGIEWAGRIEDDEVRSRMLTRIARHWLTVDAEAAEAWLEQSPLSERERAEARNPALPSYLPVR